MKDVFFSNLFLFVIFPFALLKSNSSVERSRFNLLHKNDCIELHTEISASRLQRCMPTDFIVKVCNEGAATSNQCYVDIGLAKEFGKIERCNLAYSNIDPNQYRFPLSKLKADQCITIYFSADVICNAVIAGQTLCYFAQAFPDTTCRDYNQKWSGADIKVTGECFGSTVEFYITNRGRGNMSKAGNYCIIKNDKFYLNSTFQLLAGESKIVNLPADGSTWIVEATQEPFHNEPFILSKTIEACSTNSDFSIGYTMMYPLPEQGLSHDEECQEVIDFSAPNEIVGFPMGFEHPKLISPNTELEYVIRFQNTEKSIVTNVVVEDLLPAALDPKSIHSVLSSHDYKMEIDSNHHLIFKFDNIKLSDSVTNKNLSRGFVSFRIKQFPGNYTRVLIKNMAKIFFDSKSILWTKPVYHEVGRVIGVSGVTETDKTEKTLNDLEQEKYSTIFQIETKAYDQLTWTITDFLGQKICSGIVYGKSIKLPSSYNFRGLYYLEIPTEKKGNVYRKLFL